MALGACAEEPTKAATVATPGRSARALAFNPPFFGSIPLRDINTQSVQTYVQQCARAPRTVKNHILIMRMVWKSARVWGYIAQTHNPFLDLTMPRKMPASTGTFTLDEMKRIIEAAQEPFKTMFWLAAETGMRTGEIRALERSDIETGFLRIRKSVWHGHTSGTKNGKERVFPISPALEARLRMTRGSSTSCSSFPTTRVNVERSHAHPHPSRRPSYAQDQTGWDARLQTRQPFAYGWAFRSLEGSARTSGPLCRLESDAGHVHARGQRRSPVNGTEDWRTSVSAHNPVVVS